MRPQSLAETPIHMYALLKLLFFALLAAPLPATGSNGRCRQATATCAFFDRQACRACSLIPVPTPPAVRCIAALPRSIPPTPHNFPCMYAELAPSLPPIPAAKKCHHRTTSTNVGAPPRTGTGVGWLPGMPGLGNRASHEPARRKEKGIATISMIERRRPRTLPGCLKPRSRAHSFSLSKLPTLLTESAPSSPQDACWLSFVLRYDWFSCLRPPW